MAQGLKPRAQASDDEGRRSILSDLIAQVKRGEKTPLEAEAAARAAGYDFFDDGIPDEDVTSDLLWDLPLAVLYLAWPDLKTTREQWRRFKLWGMDLWRDSKVGMPLDAAELYLHDLVSIGLVRSFGSENGHLSLIAPDLWQMLEFCQPEEDVPAKWGAAKSNGELRFSDVRVSSLDLMPAVSGAHEGLPTISKQPAKDIGGRPRSLNWDAMWIEVVRLADGGKMPSSAELTKHLQQWFTASGNKEPSDSEIRKRVGLLFDTLQWNRKTGPGE